MVVLRQATLTQRSAGCDLSGVSLVVDGLING